MWLGAAQSCDGTIIAKSFGREMLGEATECFSCKNYASAISMSLRRT